MKRSASEIINGLERRIARLEKQSYRVRPRTEAQMESYDSAWGRKNHYRVFDTEKDVERYIRSEFGLERFEFDRVPNKNYGRYFINLKQVRKAIRWDKMIKVHSLEFDKYWNVEKDSKWLRPSRLRKEEENSQVLFVRSLEQRVARLERQSNFIKKEDEEMVLDVGIIEREIKKYNIVLEDTIVNELDKWNDYAIEDIYFTIYPVDSHINPSYQQKMVTELSRKFRPLTFRWQGHILVCEVSINFDENVVR